VKQKKQFNLFLVTNSSQLWQVLLILLEFAIMTVSRASG